MDCVFCKIIKKEMVANIVFENDLVIAFEDIEPKAPVHILIVPKVHIESIDSLELKDKEIVSELLFAAQKIARDYKIDKKGYRLIVNTGKDVGQTINHLHLHLMGGDKLAFI